MRILPDHFVYGASMYPDAQRPEVWGPQLDALQRARMNTIRLADSSWGNLEPEPGRYTFDWLHDYLDLLETRGMNAILGTGSYVPPQWLAAGVDAVLVEMEPGRSAHPQARKICCLNAPRYRQAIASFLAAYLDVFASHPAVVAWQIDNELDFCQEPCYCLHCEAGWRTWLIDRYKTPEAFNQALELVHWGMRITDFSQVPQPRPAPEELPHPHSLKLLHLKYRRDLMFEFLKFQADIIKSKGIKAPLLHDFMLSMPSPLNDPKMDEVFDVVGLNVYPTNKYGARAWQDWWMEMDMARSGGGGEWLVTETLSTSVGGVMLDNTPMPRQLKCWVLQSIAFGANGLIYWSGNHFRGGHYPYWGGLFDWMENPTPELEAEVSEVGTLLQDVLIRNLEHPVDARAAVCTDFDLQAAMKVYGHTPEGRQLTSGGMHQLRRMGMAVDALSVQAIESSGTLESYQLILLCGCPTLDSTAAVDALKTWVSKGGCLIVGPMVAYQTEDGIFREDGLGSNLCDLTLSHGKFIRKPEPRSNPEQDPFLDYADGTRERIGMGMWCEILEVDDAEVEVLARYASDSGEKMHMQGEAAIHTVSYGQGQVIKLGCWPESGLEGLPGMRERLHSLLGSLLPAEVVSVPRRDGSLWLINPMDAGREILLSQSCRDRISGEDIPTHHVLQPYDILWLEAKR